MQCIRGFLQFNIFYRKRDCIMTIEELAQKIQELEKRFTNLEMQHLRLREWSDDNDLWLREMIDALTESVEKNHDLIYEFHNKE